MLIKNTKNKITETPQTNINISKEYLKRVVEVISIPRHYQLERYNNEKVKRWIKNEFESIGLDCAYQGEYGNVVAVPKKYKTNFSIIVGAHFDSVPKSPGADDNASAVAGMLAVAKTLQIYGDLPIAYVAFNREEDGLLGSCDYVESLLPEIKQNIKCCHILEMIGFCSHEPHSQSSPNGLPIKISDKGDFIAVIANRYSNKLIKPLIKTANKFEPNLPVKTLKVFAGVEKFFPHLLRSDHAPFWQEKIPSLMWTDTSEFRNPNYHQTTDTPETLDYDFMQKVSRLVAYTIMQQLG